MSKIEQAASFFHEGYNCAQAILGSYGPADGIPIQLCFRLAQGLGGGIGRLGGICGAASGAVLVIGLKMTGCGFPASTDVKNNTYQKVREFAAKFREANGSLECRELLGCDISTPEGLKYARENKIFDTRCPGLVRSAAEILEELFPMVNNT
jgi:C_GCAxxG_C_C family probable redox protein